MREEVLHDSSDDYSYNLGTLHEIRHGAWKPEPEWESYPDYLRGQIDCSWSFRRDNELDDEDRCDMDKDCLDSRIEKRDDEF